VLTILGRRSSGNVMLPLWAADELGVEHRQVDVGGSFGGNDQPAYLDKNPNGLVPTIEDGEFVLWESNAIMRYLCAKYGSGTLCPVDLQERGLAEQWMDWKLSTVMPMMTPIFWGLVRTAEQDRDLDQIQRSIERGWNVWRILDRHLERNEYVAGDAFTMGDIPLGPQIHRWLELVEDQPAMPNLEAWYQRLTERPAFREHCMNPIV
jgi:glutathione S-transferase